MIYKTHKDVYYTVAGKLNLDDEVIRTIGDFYWEGISDMISNFKKRQIYLNKLGVLTIRKAQSWRYINHIPKIEQMMRGAKRSEEAIRVSMENAEIKRQRIMVLLDEWEEIKKEREKYKEKKYAYRDLQKQIKDMGGVEEQPI